MSDKDNILPGGSNGNGKLSEERLMAYLEGKLPPVEQHEVEQWLADEGMESDAIEGLHELKPADTRHIVGKLNHNLRKTIVNKKRKRRPLDTGQFTWVAIAIILLLVVLAYLVIRKSM
jgi:hypothetical protein